MDTTFKPTHLWSPEEDPDIVDLPVELGRPVDDREQALYGARYAFTAEGATVWTWPDDLKKIRSPKNTKSQKKEKPLMTTLTVYGASDDLVELSGIPGADEYDTDGNWHGVIEAPDGATAILYVDYRDNGCWTVALGRYEEDYALPDWHVETISNDTACRYSTYVTIEVPEGTKITPGK